MATRSGTDEIRASITQHIKDNFNYRNVNGLTEVPPIRQNPTRQTQEPYVFVYSANQIETDVTKDEVSFEYQINVEVCTRFDTQQGGPRQADRILDEVVRIIRTTNNYPTVNGYDIYIITTGNIVPLEFNEEGAKYYKVIIPFYISASASGSTSQLQPQQSPIFAYSGFDFTPTSREVERWDSGLITPQAIYDSNNNGWDFVSSAYAVSAGAEGVLTSGVYTVSVDDSVLSIDSILNYSLETDATTTTSLNDTTPFPRIDSIRYGGIPGDSGQQPTFTDDTSATYGLRNLGNWNVDYGVTDPNGVRITLSGNIGDYGYIVIQSTETLSAIRDELLTDNLANFDVTVVGNYKTYVAKTPFIYDGSSQIYTLHT